MTYVISPYFSHSKTSARPNISHIRNSENLLHQNISIIGAVTKSEYQSLLDDSSSRDKMANSVSREEFTQLQKQLSNILSKQTSEKRKNSVWIEKDPPAENTSGFKPTKLPEYEGNRANYPAWRTAVLDIFRMDWNTFGYDNSRAFVLIYGALKGSALKKVGPFYETGGVNGTRDPADFIEFLDRWNLDPMRVTRANAELHVMRMGENQRWPEFFANWSNKLTEARGDFWDDANKISMIRNSLNDKLIRTLAGNHLLPEDDFNEWVRIVNQVAQQLEMVDSRNRRQHTRTQHARGPIDQITFFDEGVGEKERNQWLPDVKGRQGEIDGSGDTIMGGVNATGMIKGEKRRAKWKNEAKINQLRKEGRCFRCERQGCISRRCPLLSARSPAKSGPAVNSVTPTQIDPTMFEIEKGDENGEGEFSLSEN